MFKTALPKALASATPLQAIPTRLLPAAAAYWEKTLSVRRAGGGSTRSSRPGAAPARCQQPATYYKIGTTL